MMTKREAAVLVALLVLALAVRLYYFTGPIFANTQDEGVYYNIFLQGVLLNNYPQFTQYLNANFADPNQGIFNPAVIPTFYGGFIYPEMLLLKLLGYSANLALYYVLLTSMIEGLFLFLLIREVSGFRAASIGLLLFAFFPLDVTFADRLEPLVPAMMLVTMATYLFVLTLKQRRMNPAKAAMQGVTVGVLIGLAYLTNPISLSLLLFIAAYTIAAWHREGAAGALRFGAVLLGFAIAFSLAGAFYYTQSGNFFLYPSVDRLAAMNNIINQPVSALAQFGSMQLVRLNVEPLFYVPMFFNFPSPPPYNADYFSILGYVAVASAVALVAMRVRFSALFASMLLLYFALMNFFPIASLASGGVTKVLLVYMEPMLMTLLTLPAIALSAMGIDYALSKKGSVLWVIGIAATLAAVWIGVSDLGGAVGPQRMSVATVDGLAAFSQTVPGATFYANGYVAGELSALDGRVNGIYPMTGCSQGYIRNLSSAPNAYIVTGGTANMDVDEAIIRTFSYCTVQNLTPGSQLVYSIGNPYLGEQQLQVYKLGSGG